MMIELFKFLFIWIIVIFIFTCVSILIFNQLDNFSSIFPVIEYWFYAALGNWDNNAFNQPSDDGSSNVLLSSLGEIYQVLFLLINCVLLLNFVIAILS